MGRRSGIRHANPRGKLRTRSVRDGGTAVLLARNLVVTTTFWISEDSPTCSLWAGGADRRDGFSASC